MRRLSLFLFALSCLAQPRPDFTGEWRLSSSAGTILQIDHRDPTLRITTLAGPSATPTTAFYSTDGVERTNGDVKSVTTWDGAALVRKAESGQSVRYELAADRRSLRVQQAGETQVYQRVGLRAGVAKVDVTPTAFMAMYGYANRRCGPANGTHDPLFAKVLVLESAAAKVAIVTLDLGSFLSESLRQRLTSELGLSAVLLAASHTHSGPQFLPSRLTPTSALGAEPPDAAAYRAELDQKIFAAVKAAASAMFPARLRIGSGEAPLGYNRLVLREHGRARAEFSNPDRVPYGPFDPEFRLLEVTDAAGNAKALLVHYGVHSVVLGPTNCKYSADYPGAMQAAVEKAVPGVQAMFVQGGAGDINPIFMGRTGKEDADFALVDKLGTMLAAEVLKSRSRMHTLETDSLPLRVRGEVLRFGDRWRKDRTHEVGISTVLIGRDIAIAAMPGEPHSLFQKQWKQRADVPFALFYGYTFSAGGEWPGYVPDLRSAAYGGYGSDSTATSVEVGAGEQLLERHLYQLFDLKGMWLEAPGQN